MLARIYSPVKNAMQSGKAKNNKWALTYVPEKAKLIEPFMCYTSSQDMKQQIKLWFDSCEEAVAYAERENIKYFVEQKHYTKVNSKSYDENFVTNRVSPWTH